MALAQAIKQKAMALGFDLVGIAPAAKTDHGDYVRSFLAAGRHGEMHYLAARLEERLDPAVYFPGARSAVCVGLNYHVPLEADGDGGLGRGGAGGGGAGGDARGRIARYALADDYHELLKGRLHQLADFIRVSAPGAATRAAVDTAPVLERELAARSGIGWVGKNTMLISPNIGSYFVIGEVLTTVELAADGPAVDRCGTCTRCLEACPTGAFPVAYQMDASRCISYLTIEHRSAMAPPLEAQLGDWLYGCDICQEVCPWNSRAPTAIASELQPRWPAGTVSAAEVAGWSDEEYRNKLRRSAIKRVKLPVLRSRAMRIAGAGPQGGEAPSL
jgi:epoxyqueuosine reductase